MYLRLTIVLAAAACAVFRVEDGRACSCVGPRDVFVGPKDEEAPLNTKVRLEVPARSQGGSGAGTMVLREPDSTTSIDTTSRTAPDGALTFVELAPTKPLKPSTRYEVAVIRKSDYPSTIVIGTFKTGTAVDTLPPKLSSIGNATAKGNARAGGGDCSIHGPWIEVGPVVAEDPGRPKAKLGFAVWAGDANGAIDTTKPPAAIIDAYEGMLTIGQRSLCDPHGFPLPETAPFASLAIAAIDEAGNTSVPPKKVKVDLRGVGRHP